jgi:hypothetical protein
MLIFRQNAFDADGMQAAGDNGVYRIIKGQDGKWRAECDAYRKHSGRYRPFPKKLTFGTSDEAMALCNLFDRAKK